jgi:hypothetical protein
VRDPNRGGAQNQGATAQSQNAIVFFSILLRKFIYDPVILASVDHDYFGKFARNAGWRSLCD